jgi:hypothetical protein
MQVPQQPDQTRLIRPYFENGGAIIAPQPADPQGSGFVQSGFIHQPPDLDLVRALIVHADALRRRKSSADCHPTRTPKGAHHMKM